MRRSMSLIIGLYAALTACAPQPASPSQILPTLASLPTPTPVPLMLPFYEARAEALANAADVDVWQFNGETHDRIEIRVVSAEEAVFLLMLQTPTGTVIAQGDTIQATLPADSVYLVRVQTSHTSTINYEIGLRYADQTNPAGTNTPLPQVVGIPTPTPPYTQLGTYIGQITPGETVTGSFSGSDFNQVYTFEGKPDMFVSLVMAGIDTVDPVMTLYDPRGNPMAMDDNSGGQRGARLRNVRLPADGLYSVQVSGDGISGAYTLALLDGLEVLIPDAVTLPTATPTRIFVTPTLGFSSGATRLQSHAPVLGALESPGDFARYSFYADVGATISLSVLPVAGSGLRPLVEVYNPEGALIGTASATTSVYEGGALLTSLPIAESGAYLIIVTSEAETLGNFALSYGIGPAHTDEFRGEARTNERAEGFIQRRGMRDAWSVALGKGDVITVAVSPGSGTLDPIVELVSADGAILYSDDNSGGGKSALIRVANINDNGIYTLKVSDASGTNLGTYTLIWRYINLAPSPTPAPQTATILAVDDILAENEYRFYPFQGQQGQEIRVRVNAAPDNTLDPVAVLLAPDGSEIARGDDSGTTLNPDFTATLPDDGTYTVRVNGYLSQGLFDLSVAVVIP